MNEDLDHIVRHWVNGVPYIWYPGKGTFETAARIYMIRRLDVKFVAGDKCDIVKRYFGSASPHYINHLMIKKGRVRVNGVSYSPDYDVKTLRDKIYKDDLSEKEHRFITNKTLKVLQIPLPEKKYTTPYAKVPTTLKKFSEDERIKEIIFENISLQWFIANLSETSNICILTPPILESIHFFGNLSIDYLDDIFVGPERNLFYANFQNQLKNCMKLKVRYILIFLGVIRIYTDLAIKTKGHANLLILDKKKKRIYVFDPWGYSFTKTISEDVKGVLVENDNSFKNWKAISPLDWCPILQLKIEEEIREDDPMGFCQTWILWVAKLLMEQKGDFDLETIVHSASFSLQSVYGNDFVRFIRSFRKTIEEHPGVLKTQTLNPLIRAELKKKIKKYLQTLHNMEKLD